MATLRMAALLLGLLAVGPLAAQGLLPEPHWNLRVGGEVDSQQGQSLELGGQYLPTAEWQLHGNLNRSRLETPGMGLATSETATGGVEWRRDWFSLGADVDRTVETDQFSATRWTLRPGVEWGGLRLGLDLSIRNIAFDRFSFSNVPLAIGVDRYQLTGSSLAKVQARGIGANAELVRGGWRGYAAYTHTGYGDLDFETTVTQLRQNGQLVSPALFAALAGRLVNRLERLGASRIAQNSGLLDESGTFGLERIIDRWRIGLEWAHTRDHFSSLTADSGSLLAGWDLSARLNLELRVGQTQSQLLGKTQFAGLTLTVRGFRKPKAADLDWLGLP